MNRTSKSLFYRILDKVTNYSSDCIIEKIKKYDVISFDIFDTLVKRTVADSKDIYAMTALAVSKENNIYVDPEEYMQDRINAAIHASNNIDKDYCEEITLVDIFDNLPSAYWNIKEDLLKSEIEIEKLCCKANPVIKKVYNWCIKNCKRVVITSDMYLPEDVVITILSNCGYNTYNSLYLSSTIKKKKATGSLFVYVLKKEMTRSIIHIGDSFRSDYLKAKQNDISAILISSNPNRLEHCRIKTVMNDKEKSDYKRMKHIMNAFADPEWDEFYRYGYEVLGPLLYGFSMWLKEEVEKKCYDGLFFIARDGYLLLRAFEKLDNKNQYARKYLYVSRRSLGVPLLAYTTGLKFLIETNDLGKQWDCKMLSYRLGIEYSLALGHWKKNGIKEQEKIRGYDLLNDSRILSFYRELCEAVMDNSRNQHKLLISYLEIENFRGNIALIDTGGNGTTQKYFDTLLKGNIDLKQQGLYLWKKNTSTINAKSFPITEEELSLGNMTLVEFFLTAPEGTTLKYELQNGRVIPRTRTYEHDERTQDIIKKVQDGALHFVEIFKTSDMRECFTENISKNNIIAYSKYPLYSETKLLGSLRVFNDEVYTDMANPKSLLYYLFHSSSLVNDLKTNCWKIGFLKRLLVIPINYYKVLSILNWVRKRKATNF